jgi:hypothetical protein
MNKIILGILGVALLAGVIYFVTHKNEVQPATQTSANAETVNWKNDAENTVKIFLENAVKYGGGDKNIAISKLTSSAQSKINDDATNGWAYFVGAQEAPDKGTSIVSSQKINDTTVKVITNWSYSGQSEATIRTFVLVYENDQWKIDKIEKN